MEIRQSPIFCGAATAMITPFRDGAIDYDALDRLIEFQIAGGIDALVIAGTTGEASTLADEEHRALLRFAADRIAGRVPMIAGTGSSCYVRHNGRYSLVGGWGHLIDDAGSGFWLGKEALNAALREEDGRGERTVLTRMVNEKLGKDVRTCIGALYAGGKPMIASFAPLVLEAAGYGDRIAKEILHRAADELALLIRAGGDLIDKKPCRVALAGSLWKSELLFEEVGMRLNDDYTLLPLDVPPVLGSAVAAAEDAHVSISPAFRSRLFHALKG